MADFNYILTVFTSLNSLTLYESSYKNRVPLLLDDPPLPTFFSATLLKLDIRIQSFDDCLYILDGRFEQLHTLNIELANKCIRSTFSSVCKRVYV